MANGPEYGMSGEEAAALLRQHANLAMLDPSASDMTDEQRAGLRRLHADLFLICEQAESVRRQKRSRKTAVLSTVADGDA